jgi:hypothetical protein
MLDLHSLLNVDITHMKVRIVYLLVTAGMSRVRACGCCVVTVVRSVSLSPQDSSVSVLPWHRERTRSTRQDVFLPT